MVKLIDSVRHATSRRLATFRSISRPSTFTRITRVARCAPPAPRQRGIEGHQRRPGVIRRPPFPRHQPRALGHRPAIGQAAVAAQRPLRLRRRMHLVRRHALPRLPPVRAGLALPPPSPTPGCAARICWNWASWSFWMSMKKKLGALAGNCSSTWLRILPWISATAAKRGQAQPQRHQHQAGRPRAGPVQVGDAQPRPGLPQVWRTAGQGHQGASRPAGTPPASPIAPAQNQAANPRSGEVATVSPTSSSTSRRIGQQQPRARAHPRRQHRVPEQRRSGDLRRPRQRPQAQRLPRSAAHTAAARASGTGYSPIRGGTGSASPNSCTPAAGSPAPATTPITTPSKDSASTWIKYTPKISPLDAPRHRSVAMLRARASSQARTPVATPIPPTSSAVSPTRVRNNAGLVDEAGHARCGIRGHPDAPALAREGGTHCGRGFRRVCAPCGSTARTS